ncbi:MAG: cobalamin biosynthesis protein [Clostridia bacterium]|nr:cobalamin biosynthesis protein [Clostridia bacterium]
MVSYLDDVLNYLSARIAALIICISAFLTGLDAKTKAHCEARPYQSQKSQLRMDRIRCGRRHIHLGGTHDYFGRPVEKPTIGDADRAPSASATARCMHLAESTAADAHTPNTAIKAVQTARFRTDRKTMKKFLRGMKTSWRSSSA